jgi:hypothetical protein
VKQSLGGLKVNNVVYSDAELHRAATNWASRFGINIATQPVEDEVCSATNIDLSFGRGKAILCGDGRPADYQRPLYLSPSPLLRMAKP